MPGSQYRTRFILAVVGRTSCPLGSTCQAKGHEIQETVWALPCHRATPPRSCCLMKCGSRFFRLLSDVGVISLSPGFTYTVWLCSQPHTPFCVRTRGPIGPQLCQYSAACVSGPQWSYLVFAPSQVFSLQLSLSCICSREGSFIASPIGIKGQRVCCFFNLNVC